MRSSLIKCALFFVHFLVVLAASLITSEGKFAGAGAIGAGSATVAMVFSNWLSPKSAVYVAVFGSMVSVLVHRWVTKVQGPPDVGTTLLLLALIHLLTWVGVRSQKEADLKS